MNGSVVLASGVEASRLGSETFPGLQRRGGRGGRHGAGIERGVSLGAVSSCNGHRAGQVDRDRDARSVVALDRPQAPRQVLTALVGLLRGAGECHARFQRVVSKTPVSGSACSL